MAEREFSVVAVNVRYFCDECDQGELLPTGTCFTSNPPVYPHKCTNCDSGRTFNFQYPRIVYKEIG